MRANHESMVWGILSLVFCLVSIVVLAVNCWVAGYTQGWWEGVEFDRRLTIGKPKSVDVIFDEGDRGFCPEPRPIEGKGPV